ncbi:MAG: glycosyltransferase family 2 protein [candidate division KSB1 bacterium]|nr:glycosyltransferase family 2 protein [candidate division KSB1 bacterium]MDZ7275438.1 glycosyltransferase family 2 protein [candidate division KSB1 bacterium]MDZ7286249.1 glycosyltransferase family 2 protein [candidate division KSB1 bacterium]MDZ7296475.1 glycosyltransferase family 2 protein [candidate division KSB1 bacterium]MDZ7305566.1 glycosyltransferase family 2 protein [candidate division KSB1 bacterium]
MDTSAVEVTAVLPAYNPGGAISKVLAEVSDYLPKDHILVVDDGSTDGLQQRVAEAGVQVLRHERNRGKGAALRTAFDFVKRHSTSQAIITLDADGQHPPREIPGFIRAFVETGADLIIGHRSFDFRVMPLARIASNRITSALLSRKLGVEIKDSQCGYRLHSRLLIEQITLETEGYDTESEVIIKACRAGCKVHFHPIATVYAGQKSHIHGARDIYRFITLYFRT